MLISADALKTQSSFKLVKSMKTLTFVQFAAHLNKINNTSRAMSSETGGEAAAAPKVMFKKKKNRNNCRRRNDDSDEEDSGNGDEALR